MKLLFSLLALIMLNKECDNTKTDGTKAAPKSDQSKVMQDAMIITYEASTRGFYEIIWISKDLISVSNDRDHIEKTSFATPAKDWNELMDVLNKIDLQTLPTLEAPTAMRHYDGAPFATLMVTQNIQETKTENFDHGHPPKPIEALVNKVLSMREMVKKP